MSVNSGGVRQCDGGVPDRMASNFAAVIARAAAAPTVLILLTDGEQLRPAGTFGVPARWAQAGRTPTASTLAGLVIGHEHPIIIDDIIEDPRVPRYAPALALGVRAYAGFPIRDPEQRIVGVCTVVDTRPRSWSPEELATVDQGAQACTALVAERQAREHADTQRCFLDALLQSLRTGVGACDEHGRLVFVNEVLHELSGAVQVGASLAEWSRYGCLTDAQGRRLPPEAVPLLRALRGEYLRDLDLTVAPSDRRPRAVSADAQPITGAGGRLLGAVLTLRDVSEERRTERFRRLERAASEALAYATSVRQAGGLVLAAACKSFGWPLAELWLVDPDADALVRTARHPADDPEESTWPGNADPLTVAAWRSGRPVCDFATPNGSSRPPAPALSAGRTLAAPDGPSHPTAPGLTGSPAPTAPGDPSRPAMPGLAGGRILAAADGSSRLAVPALSGGRVLAVLSFAVTAVEDPIEPLVALLSTIAASIAELLERRRAEELTLALARSRDDYLVLIGHELRTPLTAIAAYVEMMREADPGTIAEDLPEMLDVLSRNSACLRRIVDQLLDLAALDNGHADLAHEPVDLPATVRAAAEAARPAADDAGVTLALDLRSAAPVSGDATRLRQVVDELLDNAVKHTPPGGHVTAVLTQPAAAVVELTISDTGVGVSADERERLFGRFYRSQRTRERRIPGNGLGLAISRAIVEGHRGSIRLVPIGEPGTRITVRLPVTPP